MRVLYLHGFASSAQSSKAAFFRERFAARGITLEVPDFNEPDFSSLTISRMLERVRRDIEAGPDRPAVLIGSSLGGFVAVQSAVESAGRVDRLVLLAPALDFSGTRVRDLGDRGLEEWRATGTLNVYHYGYGRLLPVHYELFTDAQRYQPLAARVGQPVLAFQGRMDASVDPGMVERWAASRPNVALHMLDDDHQLHASLPYIWTETARFLGLP